MTKEDLRVGQTVYLEPRGNAARRDDSIVEGVVTKVGRKYFEVGHYGKFYLYEGLQVTEYTPSWKVYLSKREIALYQRVKSELLHLSLPIIKSHNRTY